MEPLSQTNELAASVSNHPDGDCVKTRDQTYVRGSVATRTTAAKSACAPDDESQ